MNWKISSKSQILILSAIGVSHTIMELYSSKPNILEEIWQMELEETFKPYQNLIKTVISGMIIARGLTGHVYIALYFLILYPVIMERLRSVMLLWMFLSAIRSIILNFGITIIGLALCSLIPQMNPSCMNFVAWKACEVGCSIYMWTVVNDYYHSLKRRSTRHYLQSPLSSSSSIDDTSSLLLSDEWSLPASLVEEFQRSTKDNINESGTKAVSNSTKDASNSVDSLLAQAMVDWFMKKIIKIKPKSQNKDSPDAKISTMKTSDVTALRERLKKSIAAIDQDDLKDLVQPDTAVPGLDVNVASSGERSGKIGKNHLENDSTRKTLNRILTAIPDSVTLRNDINKQDETKIFPITDQFQNFDVNYLTSTIVHVENNDSNQDGARVEPIRAVEYVKQLFSDNIIVKIGDDNCKPNRDKKKSKIVYKKTLHMTGNSNKKVDVEEVINENSYQNESEASSKPNIFTGKKCMIPKEIELAEGSTKDEKGLIFLDKIFENKNNESFKFDFDLNENALDCSIAIVQSLIDGAVDKASMNTGLPEVSHLHGNCSSTILLKIKKTKIINPNNCVTDKENDFINLHRNVSGNPLKNNNYQTIKESTCKYSVPERVKCVNSKYCASRITDQNWKLIKPYNKENEYDKGKHSNLVNNEINVKALRYHYRRINQNKIPIRKPRENILSHNSLKAILEDIKYKENKKSLLDLTKCSYDKALSHLNTLGINKSKPISGINDKLKMLNFIKDKSSQTMINKKLLQTNNEIKK